MESAGRGFGQAASFYPKLLLIPTGTISALKHDVVEGITIRFGYSAGFEQFISLKSTPSFSQREKRATFHGSRQTPRYLKLR